MELNKYVLLSSSYMSSRRLLPVEFQLDSDSDTLVVIGWVVLARQADDGWETGAAQRLR
jgi:hypothetical protein